MTKQKRKLKLVYRDKNVLILSTEDGSYAEATINDKEFNIEELLNAVRKRLGLMK